MCVFDLLLFYLTCRRDGVNHTPMIRTFIEKLNELIQWSKKWHFFHIFFALSFAILCFVVFSIIVLYFLAYIVVSIDSIFDPSPVVSDEVVSLTCDDWAPGGVIIFVLYLVILPAICSIIWFFVSLFTQIVIMIKRKRAHKSCTVQTSFLLNNQYYNIFYIISIFLPPLTFIISCILLM